MGVEVADTVEELAALLGDAGNAVQRTVVVGGGLAVLGAHVHGDTPEGLLLAAGDSRGGVDGAAHALVEDGAQYAPVHAAGIALVFGQGVEHGIKVAVFQIEEAPLEAPRVVSAAHSAHAAHVLCAHHLVLHENLFSCVRCESTLAQPQVQTLPNTAVRDS